MPSVLVELGFLTNPNEEDFLQSEDGKIYMASALFRAFREYRDIHQPQITNEPIVEPANESESEPKPQPADGVTFSVQIASSSTELDKSDPVFRGLQNVDMYLSGGQYKYTTGLFGVAEDAHEKKRELRDQGFSGAFVAAFKDGKRVPMSSILEEIKSP